MDPYLEQKEAELTRAQSQCVFLEDEYAKSQKALETEQLDSDFVYNMEVGSLLMLAREDKAELESAVTEARKEREEPKPASWGLDYLPYSEFTFTTFNRYSVYVYLGIGLIGFIALCTAIGW